MAITATNLTSGTDTDAGSTSTTASITPKPNTLILLLIATRTTANDPNHPTVTGCGLTWTEIISVNFDNVGSQKRLTLLGSMGASPVTGTLAIDFNSQGQSDVVWSVDQFSGTSTLSTNYANAVVQSASNFLVSNPGPGNDLIVTLATFANNNNATYGGFCWGNGASTMVAEAGYTLLSSPSTTNVILGAEWKGINDTSVEATGSAAGEEGGVAIEITMGRSFGFVTSILRPRPFAPGLAR